MQITCTVRLALTDKLPSCATRGACTETAPPRAASIAADDAQRPSPRRRCRRRCRPPGRARAPHRRRALAGRRPAAPTTPRWSRSAGDSSSTRASREPPGTSCASCHDPARAFSGTHGSTIGVPRGSRPGHFARRTTPSVLYLRYVPRSTTSRKTKRRGRRRSAASSGTAAPTRSPRSCASRCFNPDEMNDRDAHRSPPSSRGAPYADELRARARRARSTTPRRRCAALGAALEAFLTSDEMAPFTSKFDDYVRGARDADAATSSAGLTLFKDPRKGACARCHRLNETSTDPARSLFTDYGYDAVGAPRNRALPAPATDAFDLGPLRAHATPSTPVARRQWCAQLPHAVAAQRRRARRVHAQRRLHRRCATSSPSTPRASTDRRAGTSRASSSTTCRRSTAARSTSTRLALQPPPRRPPALDDGEIDAIVAFLGTLTDAPYRAAGAPARP